MASDEYLKAVDAIQNVNDTDELIKLSRVLREQHSYVSKEKAQEFKIGQDVSFKEKNGSVRKGKVNKINRKSIGVVVDGFINYRVHPSLLIKEIKE